MRGATVIAMIIVNNADTLHLTAPAFHHSTWNGITLCDLVFPFFLFMVGITTALSRPPLTKILRRTLTLLLIGWALSLIESGTLRLTGVLPRIALCYLLAALLHRYCRTRTLIIIATALLLAYSALLLLAGGYSPTESNILSIVDRALLGASHLYTKSPIDPEGLLSTCAALAHTLLAVILWRTSATRPTRLLLLALTLTLTGVALTPLLPLNKRIWSPSYALLTCGLAAATLATLLHYELRKRAKGRTAFANVQNAERNHETTKSRNNETTKQRNNETTKQRNNNPLAFVGRHALTIYIVAELTQTCLNYFL